MTGRYPRSARVNEVLREVLADSIERMGDERLALLTVTAVKTEPDLRHATVLFASLKGTQKDALEHVRGRLQAAVAHELRLKRTPKLSFEADPAVSTGQRVEDILRELRRTEGRAGE
jgi:ribosome-binding factor A